MVIEKQRNEIRLQMLAIEKMVSHDLRRKGKGSKGRGQRKVVKGGRENDPLWASTVTCVETNVAPMLLLLQNRWWEFGTGPEMFCMAIMRWMGHDKNLPEGYNSLAHLWVDLREHVNEAMSNARTGCRMRVKYRWDGECRLTCKCVCASANVES